MRRSFTVHKQLIGFAIFAMLMCFCGFMQRVQADNADLGGVNLSIQYRVCKNDSFSLLSMFPSQNEPEPFIIQYGDETVTIPHKEEYNYQDPDGNYYSYPRYVLESGWLDGKAIKLVNVPVPDGYELCISGQPVVTNESIGFGTNYISLSIPIRKAGEKVVMSNMNEIHTDIEVVDGKPVVTVTNGWYPLTEGVDYTLSWQYLQNQFSLQVTVNGIGTYTAGAIGSIAFDLQVPAVDGNVMRVLSRLWGDDSDILKEKTKREMGKRIQAYIPKDRPGDFNQALIELGAIVCIPNGKPLCDRCPWDTVCRAYREDRIDQLPVKKPKKARRKEYKTVFLLETENRVALHKREEKGLLAGLWEFPNVSGRLDMEEIKSQLRQWGIESDDLEPAGKGKHIFSHVEWHMKGVKIRLKEAVLSEQFQWIDKKDLENTYALPSAFEIFRKVL